MEEMTPMQTENTEELHHKEPTQTATISTENAAETSTENNNDAAAKQTVTNTVTENFTEAATTEATEDSANAANEVPVEEIDYSTLSREDIVSTLRELLAEDIQKARHNISALRNRFNDLNHELRRDALEAFVAEGGKREDFEAKKDELDKEFDHLYEQYRERRQRYQEELEAKKKENLAKKQALVDELKGLVDSGEEQVRTALDKFNDIQERWKAIGEVPREQMNDLWQSYHFQIEQFFSKLKIGRELRALDQKKNLEGKIALCEKAEELTMESSVTKAFKALQDLRSQWKEIGPVPPEVNEEIWQRFQTAANRIDERRREWNEQRKEELDNNLLAKQALVDKATELTAERPAGVRQWNDVTSALDELLKVWKTIGPVPREVNEEIWSKFKGIIDKHYADKKEFFSTIRDEQEVNYQKKIELCLKAEAIAQREDWKKATEELLELQKEWKEIGATSRKVSEKVWQRFRGACDEFFAKKGEFFKERRASEHENLAKKEAILEELKSHQWGENREENLEAIKDFQRRWAEAGFVPMADKERLHKEFRGEIDRVFEQLRISAREAEETAYRERLKNVAGDTRKFVVGERQELMDKIEKLRADLKLWENNLGFLASSKQADLLKQEFEKKMQGARQQIALLHAKLKILDESEKQD